MLRKLIALSRAGVRVRLLGVLCYVLSVDAFHLLQCFVVKALHHALFCNAVILDQCVQPGHALFPSVVLLKLGVVRDLDFQVGERLLVELAVRLVLLAYERALRVGSVSH